MALLPETDRAAPYEVLLGRKKVLYALGRRDAEARDPTELEEIAPRLGAQQQEEAAIRRAWHANGAHDHPAIMAAAQQAAERARAAGRTAAEVMGHLF